MANTTASFIDLCLANRSRACAASAGHLGDSLQEAQEPPPTEATSGLSAEAQEPAQEVQERLPLYNSARGGRSSRYPTLLLCRILVSRARSMIVGDTKLVFPRHGDQIYHL